MFILVWRTHVVEVAAGLANTLIDVWRTQVVEVADYNMECRPRVLWTKIWGVLSDFFSQVRG